MHTWRYMHASYLFLSVEFDEFEQLESVLVFFINTDFKRINNGHVYIRGGMYIAVSRI